MNMLEAVNIDALEAGEELDAIVEALVMRNIGFMALSDIGGLIVKRTMGIEGSRKPRAFSTFMGETWLLVEYLRKQKIYLLHLTNGETTYGVTFGKGITTPYQWSAVADTAPLAICRAALKAVSGPA